MNETLRKLREMRGWTQTRLAKESGVSQTYISELEAGKSMPTIPIVRKLATALGVPTDVLIGESAPAAAGGVGGGCGTTKPVGSREEASA